MSKEPTTPWIPPPVDLGLFFWNSSRDETEKRAITAWYRSLDPQSRKYVDALRDEQRDETEWNCDASEF